jgi:NADH-quinone oxidoreductase subunit N
MEFITPLAPAYAEIFLLCMACFILVLDLFISDRQRVLTYGLALVALLGCFAITFFYEPEAEPYTLNGMFVADPLAIVLKLFVYLVVAAMLIYSRRYVRERGMFSGEFFVLALFATLGMMVMISANHLLSLYLGLELMSLSLYALVALQRDSAASTEAAMKYFVLGALASGMLLYGMSMLYGATGSLEITAMAEIIQNGAADNTILAFALVFIVAGIGFKLGAVPFHMWLPDVYHGAPTAVTVLVGSAPKLAAFAFLLRVLAQGLGADELAVQWQWMLIIMAVASLAIGNVTAIAQTNIKRMLGYSTISHVGFVLLAVLAANNSGYASALFYSLIYVIMNLGAFAMVLLLSRAGFEADRLDDFRGLNQRSPWHAFLMLLLMFSMAGVPPTVGFYAKVAVLRPVIELGGAYIWLAAIAVVFALIGAFYYLRVVKLMYFDEPLDHTPIRASADMNWLLGLNGLALLVFGIRPGPLMTICEYSINLSLQ